MSTALSQTSVDCEANARNLGKFLPNLWGEKGKVDFKKSSTGVG